MSKEKETGKEKGRIRQLARYYIPYKGLFFTDMFFAMLGAAITLVIPLIVRYITSTVVEKPLEQATGEIIRLGILMIAMVLVEMYCNFYIAYYGHVMGARIEHDMRNEIFGHYQKLSFAFFDNQKVGHLLSRITSDLFDISELLHHGPEDIVISFIKLIGAMIILFVVNPMLACVPLVVIVVMLLFALLILRGFWIALHAKDRFGTLMVVGIMTLISLQTFLNIAVVTGLIPATGISLPFFSYGGTALALQLFEMGIVLSVSRQIPAPRNG